MENFPSIWIVLCSGRRCCGLTEELVKAAQRGDESALLELLAPLEKRLYCTALSALNNAHDAEEAWQNTVIKVWRQIRKLRNPALFRVWLTRILLNETTNLLRLRARMPLPYERLPEAVAPDSDFERFVAVREQLQLIPEPQRQAVILRFWLDLSLDEIALALEIPLGTAKTRLYQGIKSLRANMEKEELSDER